MAAKLFSPYQLRDVSLPNRIVVPPMCQYMAIDGVPTDWHLVHLGQLAQSSPGLIIAEATGVSHEARITPHCTGLYSDESEKAFARIGDFIRSVGESKFGIQLVHAGRKGSTAAPWDGGGQVLDENGWPSVAPSAVPYLPNWQAPAELGLDDIAKIKNDFAEATKRADRAGMDLIEIHAAHGYLLHQFFSPITNKRTDSYGGSLENRIRLTLEIFKVVRNAFPANKPVIVRISATDWIEGGWDIESSIVLSRELKALGCDMINVSTGGLDQSQKIPSGPGYQVEFSEKIRTQAQIPTIAVGQITNGLQAETILQTHQADLIGVARAMLWDPRWSWRAAVELGIEVNLPAPYARCNPAMRGKPFLTRR